MSWISTTLNSLLARRLPARPVISLNDARRILVIELGGLGDAIHVLPVLAALHQPVTVVCRDYVAELFEMTGYKAVGITKSRAGLQHAVRTLGDAPWDVVVSTCWSTWTTALALRLKAKALVGFWRPWRVESFGVAGPMPVVSRNDHLALLRWKAVAALGVAVPGVLPVPRIEVPPGVREGVVFVPFCDDARKSLTDSEARQVLAAMPARVLGGKAEAARLRRYDGAIVTSSIRELVATLAGARLVVSVDTGAMHLAAAVGTPTVGIFKSTDPRRCGPLGSHTMTIRAEQLHQVCLAAAVTAKGIATASE